MHGTVSCPPRAAFVSSAGRPEGGATPPLRLSVSALRWLGGGSRRGAESQRERFRVRRRRLSCLFVLAPQGEPKASVPFSVRRRRLQCVQWQIRPLRRRRANEGREAPPIRRSGRGSLAARSFPFPLPPRRTGPLELLRSVFSSSDGTLPLKGFLENLRPHAEGLCHRTHGNRLRRTLKGTEAFGSPCGADTKRHESRLRRTRKHSVVEHPAPFVSREAGFRAFSCSAARPSEGRRLETVRRNRHRKGGRA